MNGWITVFPKQGEWLHLHNLLTVGILNQWLEENYRKTRIRALTISGNEMRKWRLTTKDKVNTFCVYLRNNVGTDKCKLRIEAKKRHHRLPDIFAQEFEAAFLDHRFVLRTDTKSR